MTLCCPYSRQALTPATTEGLVLLKARREAGTLRNLAGEMPEPFEAALATSDGAVFYPIRGGIPVLLPGEGMSGGS